MPRIWSWDQIAGLDPLPDLGVERIRLLFRCYRSSSAISTRLFFQDAVAPERDLYGRRGVKLTRGAGHVVYRISDLLFREERTLIDLGLKMVQEPCIVGPRTLEDWRQDWVNTMKKGEAGIPPIIGSPPPIPWRFS